MLTKRQAINKFRKDLNEVNADTGYTNQYLYNSLMVHAKWLIKREISAGRVYKNTAVFQKLPCRDVIEVSSIDATFPVQANCKIYRTKEKLPEMWMDNDGPVIKTVTSVDDSTKFTITTITTWQNKKKDPYQKFSKEKYCFFQDGYLWFPEQNPHSVNINAFFTDDVSKYTCDGVSECVTFLDTKFMVPDWIEGELFAKAFEQVAGGPKRLPEDQQIDKNSTRRN